MLQLLTAKGTCAKTWASVLPTNPTLGINPVMEHQLQTPPAPFLKQIPLIQPFETKRFNILLHPGSQNSGAKLLPFPEMHFPSSLRISLRSFTLAVVTFTANRFRVSEI